MSVRVRFAPSPTGNVHIGNIRVAIFNWLFARHQGGSFLLRIEDTDLERSTPEAIQNMIKALEWLKIDYDEEPVYQTHQRTRHEEGVQRLVELGHASCGGDGEPTLLHIDAKLFNTSIITEPRDPAEIKVSKGDLTADARSFYHVTTSKKSGETFSRPINWDMLADLRLILESGDELDGTEIRQRVTDAATDGPVDVHALCGGRVSKLAFTRRYVVYDDLVLGRLEKPLDSLRDMVIARSDGSPVFHLANVIDDADQGITHILRGNDHVENTYRHLLIFTALGLTPPQYAHFPMIVNESGKPYSKRDGDAYIGDFRSKGYLPDCLFNFLALCGWAPGDDREIMTRQEMIDAFSLERVNSSAAQLNLEKLEWMNGQYLTRLSTEELMPLVQEELAHEGIEAGTIDSAWLARLIEIEQERMRTIPEFVANTRYFFSEEITLDEKAVRKVLQKNDGAGLSVLRSLRDLLATVTPWDEPTLESIITRHTEENALKMGQVAQPLRVACTGGTVSPGIWETLTLLGKEKSLARIDATLATVEVTP